MQKPTIYLIGGPTASGKSAMALDMAHKVNGVIINADAMQVYAGLPILTAQPDGEAKKAAPHELYEVFPPSFKSSAGKWLELAEGAIKETLARKRVPILVGGTGMYFNALCGGLSDIPPIPESARIKAQELYDKSSSEGFRAALLKLDPVSAERIKPNDKQRLIRAYEVALHTGKPIEHWQKQGKNPGILESLGLNVERILIMPQRDELYAACDGRFLKMIDQGAVEEVRSLMAMSLDKDCPSMKILGVRELTEYLEGKLSLDEAITKAQQSTRNYAKRQSTWFRNQWKDYFTPPRP
ncbi:MAG: tRNA (adenosine(37)-N6)-dimethylallyltransferase MiaA [Alphaproteobacteria bacterium]|nr:tRNA (adenosine(37)-N6)-dimethylallyltransferase MiaA [Alphaproteobacteria bacterium]